MEDIAGWVAPAATMIAAIMTAANLGTRVTGWGFVVFTVGSIGWIIVALTTGQQNLLWSNGFLTLVNAIGIWRWLGRQARYDDGGQRAVEESAAARVPTLFPMGRVVGATLTGRDGQSLGQVIEGMVTCRGTELAYLVVSEGGVGGIGERLHALAPHEVRFSEDGVACDLDAETLAARPVLDPKAWPAAI